MKLVVNHGSCLLFNDQAFFTKPSEKSQLFINGQGGSDGVRLAVMDEPRILFPLKSTGRCEGSSVHKDDSSVWQETA